MAKKKKSQGRILIVEDDEALSATLSMVLTAEDYEIECAADGALGAELAHDGDFDLVLTDYRLPGLGGMQLLEGIAAERPNLPVVMMTSHGTADLAISASRRGAFDYLLKPFDTEEMLEVVAKAVRAGRSMSKKVTLGEPAGAGSNSTAMIGSSRAMRDTYREIGLVAETKATVLIRGETGVGKELVARAIYKHSDRADGQFIAVNCGAIPENLLESELFGHLRGAFTGADMRRVGRFEQADGGTLFLDEIGDMPAQTQVKILRALQERSVRPLGGTEEIPVDVRVIAATHRNLEAMIAEGDFREDLLYRLNTVTISIPPLREREDDVKELVNHLSKQAATDLGLPTAKVNAKGMAKLCAHSWPGNVRELDNVVTKLVIQARGAAIGAAEVEGAIAGTEPASSLPASGDGTGPGAASMDDRIAEVLKDRRSSGSDSEGEGAHALLVGELEKKLIRAALELSGGNQSEVARLLGISRVTLKQKMTKFGLSAKPD